MFLKAGDVGVIFTDGIIEAENLNGAPYNVEQLIEAIKHNLPSVAIEIRFVVIDDLRQHIGQYKVYDDITLVVLKQK